MDRLFTVAYLPVCLLMLGLLIKFNNMPGRPRILFSFAGFVLIMLAIPLVNEVSLLACNIVLIWQCTSSAHCFCCL
jgi:equilibrative nucleoside transporter 1/2/3